MKKRDTIGKISLDLMEKSHDDTHTPREQMLEQLKDFEKHIELRIESGKKEFPGDFYIVVETKKEPLMPNVLRNYFISRQSCPTPGYDQTVYRYNRKSGSIEFMWVMPAKDICIYLVENSLELPEDQRDLLDMVLNFNDGTLLKVAKKLNGERADSPVLEKGN